MQACAEYRGNSVAPSMKAPASSNAYLSLRHWKPNNSIGEVELVREMAFCYVVEAY